jgi:hypothetical protein
LPMLDIEHEWSPSQRQRIFSLFAWPANPVWESRRWFNSLSPSLLKC